MTIVENKQKDYKSIVKYDDGGGCIGTCAAMVETMNAYKFMQEILRDGFNSGNFAVPPHRIISVQLTEVEEKEE